MHIKDNELLDFLHLVADDHRISGSHINLYVALHTMASSNVGGIPIVIYGAQVVKKARISRRTYDKCIRELMEFGYIRYEPSNDPAKGSLVFFNRL